MLVEYEVAQKVFHACGLSVQSGFKRPYSTNFQDLSAAARMLHMEPRLRCFSGWDNIRRGCVVKVSNGQRSNWHWVFAARTEETGLVVLDPMPDAICAERAPFGVEALAVPYHQVTGSYIEMEPGDFCLTKGGLAKAG